MLSRTLLAALLLLPACATARPDEVDSLLQESIDDLSVRLSRLDQSMRALREERSREASEARRWSEELQNGMARLAHATEAAAERNQIENEMRALQREVSSTRGELERAIGREHSGRTQLEQRLAQQTRAAARARQELGDQQKTHAKARSQISQLSRALASAERKLRSSESATSRTKSELERAAKSLRAAEKKLRTDRSALSKLQRALSQEQRLRKSAEQKAKAAASRGCRCTTHERCGSNCSCRKRRGAIN